MGGGWFPAGKEAMKLSRKLFPDAHVEEVEDGLDQPPRPDGGGGPANPVAAPRREPDRMPRLERPDGVELHWEERGEGPLRLESSR